MARPFILYENLLEGATLTASTTASGYDVDALKTRVPKDRWTSTSELLPTVTAQLATATLPTALAITFHDIASATPAAAVDDFDRADEDDLAGDWTNNGTEDLNLHSNRVTNEGAFANTSTTAKNYYHATVAFDEDGTTGFVDAEIEAEVADGFAKPVIGGNYGGSSSKLVWAMLNFSDDTIKFYTGVGTSATLHGSQSLSAVLVAGTKYTLSFSFTPTLFTATINGGTFSDETVTQVPNATYWPYTGGDRKPAIGIFGADDPTTNRVYFDNFIGGQLATGTEDTGTVVIKGGTDGSTWPYQKTFTLEGTATFMASFDDAASYEYWQVEFPSATARALTVGCLALGRRLDFTESMAQGFDPSAERLISHQNRSNSGEYLGQIVRFATQNVSLKFGPAGLSTTDFFNVTGSPSWEEFFIDNWRPGRPHWFAWDIVQRPRDLWFCMVPDKARSSSSFITAIRRGWRTAWDVLVERVNR